MRTYYFYDPTTGEFTGQGLSCNKPDATAFLEKNLPTNANYIEFNGNIKNYKVNVETGEIEEKTNVAMTPFEIRQQISILREEYMRTRDESLLAGLELLKNELNSG